METVRIAVVGAGHIAQHAHLPALRQVQAANVIALVDRSIARARYVAERFRIPKVYRSVKELLENEVVDALDVCTPTDQHRDVALQGLEAGCHVFIERPIARNVEEARQIVSMAQQAERIVMVGMRHRFRNDIMLLKTQVDQKLLGELSYIEGFWYAEPSSSGRWFTQRERAGGGVLADLGIVLLDLFQWFVTAPVQQVYAQLRRFRLRKAEDFAVVVLRFNNGAIGKFSVSWSLPLLESRYQLELFGRRGHATLRPLRIETMQDGAIRSLPLPPRPRNQYTLYKQSYQQELQHFINAVRSLVAPVSTAQEALRVMQLVEACYQSEEQQQPVVFGD